MSAIRAFLTYSTDHVGLVNSATMIGQIYFRNLFFVTLEYMLPAAPTNHISHEKSVKKVQSERVFAGPTLSFVWPTAIYALLKFKKVGIVDSYCVSLEVDNQIDSASS
jgi:hypothetical protein